MLDERAMLFGVFCVLFIAVSAFGQVSSRIEHPLILHYRSQNL